MTGKRASASMKLLGSVGGGLLEWQCPQLECREREREMIVCFAV